MIGQVTEVDEDGVPMALAHGEDGERAPACCTSRDLLRCWAEPGRRPPTSWPPDPRDQIKVS